MHEKESEILRGILTSLSNEEIMCLSLYLFCGGNTTILTKRIYGEDYQKSQYQQILETVSFCIKKFNVSIKINPKLKDLFTGDYKQFQALMEVFYDQQ